MSDISLAFRVLSCWGNKREFVLMLSKIEFIQHKYYKKPNLGSAFQDFLAPIVHTRCSETAIGKVVVVDDSRLG